MFNSIRSRSRCTDVRRSTLASSSLDSFRLNIIGKLAATCSALDPTQALSLLFLSDSEKPLSLLFQKNQGQEGFTSMLTNFRRFLVYVRAAYEDRTLEPYGNHAGVLLHSTIDAAAVVISRYPEPVIEGVVAHLIAGMAPDFDDEFDFAAVERMLEEAPYFSRSWLPPDRRWHGDDVVLPYHHAASPFLLCAYHLALHSKAAASRLVEHGLVGRIERLYDSDGNTPSHGAAYEQRRKAMVVKQSRKVMLELCYGLLVCVSKQCDLRDCMVMEELRLDVMATSRALSERHFGIFLDWKEIRASPPY